MHIFNNSRELSTSQCFKIELGSLARHGFCLNPLPSLPSFDASNGEHEKYITSAKFLPDGKTISSWLMHEHVFYSIRHSGRQRYICALQHTKKISTSPIVSVYNCPHQSYCFAAFEIFIYIFCVCVSLKCCRALGRSYNWITVHNSVISRSRDRDGVRGERERQRGRERRRTKREKDIKRWARSSKFWPTENKSRHLYVIFSVLRHIHSEIRDEKTKALPKKETKLNYFFSSYRKIQYNWFGLCHDLLLNLTRHRTSRNKVSLLFSYKCIFAFQIRTLIGIYPFILLLMVLFVLHLRAIVYCGHGVDWRTNSHSHCAHCVCVCVCVG